MNTYTQLPLNLNTRRMESWTTFAARMPRGERPELEIVSRFRDEPTTEPDTLECGICGCTFPKGSGGGTINGHVACAACCRPIEDQTGRGALEGTYTIVYSTGDHFTFRVKALTTGSLAGKTIVEYLAGPDNDNDFVGFGFIDPPTARVSVWKRYQHGDMPRKAYHIRNMFNNGAAESAGMAYAMRAGRCRRCNRTLTVPASIHRGYGPECINHV